jgi:penicillin amidase
MKTSGRHLVTTLVVAGALSFVFASPPDKNGSSIPQYGGTISVHGLTDCVTVYRDERGIPHIFAANEPDLYFATGYITAQDRLWQMDLIRRCITGRLAEIFGEDYVGADMLTRCLQIMEKGRLIIENEDPAILCCLKAYTDGVNAFISQPGKKLPVEFRLLKYKPDRWTLEDIAGIIGLLGWSLGSKNLDDELFNYELIRRTGAEKASHLIPGWDMKNEMAYPDFHLDDTAILSLRSITASAERIKELGVSASEASNNWAVTGKRSDTGKPLLSNDMHLSLSCPGIWMQMHQIIPGRLNVTGVIVPGEPFIVAGHNERIAWGMTNLMVDDIDLYAEKINPENHGQYFFNGEWNDLVCKTEIIRVRRGRQDTVIIRFTHRGPLITALPWPAGKNEKAASENTGYPAALDSLGDVLLSMKWAGNDRSDEIRSVYLINRARGWDDFRNALSTFRSVSQNFVYADVEGNIGLQAAGGVPLRKGNGIMIRSGATDEYDWKGYVPFEHLPFSFNPDKGEVSSANNKTTGDDYPYFISQNFWAPYRITRIRQMLGNKEILGTEDFKSMVTDQHSYLASLLTPLILSLNDSITGLSPLEKAAMQELSGWDYDMDRSLAAPAIFEFFRSEFKRNLLADEMGDLYDRINYLTVEYYVYRIITESPDEWIDDVNTPVVETLNDIVLKSFREGVAVLAEQYGRNLRKWQWGRAHTITFTHPIGTVKILGSLLQLNSRTYGIGGSDHTVCPYFSFTHGFKVDLGASVRHIFNTADWDESWSVIPGGESGAPLSEFYLSQVETYLKGGFYKDHFSDHSVRESARYTLVLKPGE